jgi:uncharacterized RDD family membrane protein YckC
MDQIAESQPGLEAPVEVPPAARPASFWLRAGAILLDYVFLVIVVAVAQMASSVIWGEAGRTSRVLNAALTAFRWFLLLLYPVLFHWFWGQTMGKMVVRARVVAFDGGPLSFRRALGRTLAWLLSALPLGAGFIVAGVRRDRRALHDLLAGTRVERL